MAHFEIHSFLAAATGLLSLALAQCGEFGLVLFTPAQGRELM